MRIKVTAFIVLALGFGVGATVWFMTQPEMDVWQLVPLGSETALVLQVREGDWGPELELEGSLSLVSRDGEPLWEQDLVVGYDSVLWGQNEVVLYHDDDGTLTRFSADTGEVLWRVDSTPMGRIAHVESGEAGFVLVWGRVGQLIRVDLSTGDQHWSIAFPPQDDLLQLRVVGPPLLIAAVGSQGMYHVDIATGEARVVPELHQACFTDQDLLWTNDSGVSTITETRDGEYFLVEVPELKLAQGADCARYGQSIHITNCDTGIEQSTNAGMDGERGQWCRLDLETMAVDYPFELETIGWANNRERLMPAVLGPLRAPRQELPSQFPHLVWDEQASTLVVRIAWIDLDAEEVSWVSEFDVVGGINRIYGLEHHVVMNDEWGCPDFSHTRLTVLSSSGGAVERAVCASGTVVERMPIVDDQVMLVSAAGWVQLDLPTLEPVGPVPDGFQIEDVTNSERTQLLGP